MLERLAGFAVDDMNAKDTGRFEFVDDCLRAIELHMCVVEVEPAQRLQAQLGIDRKRIHREPALVVCLRLFVAFPHCIGATSQRERCARDRLALVVDNTAMNRMARLELNRDLARRSGFAGTQVQRIRRNPFAVTPMHLPASVFGTSSMRNRPLASVVNVCFEYQIWMRRRQSDD